LPAEELIKLTKLKKNLGVDFSKRLNFGLSDVFKNYHIFSGLKKNPSRPKILALAIAMGLNLEEIQYLLRYARQSPLYPRNPWDSIIISAVEQKLDVFQTNELLNRLGETVLIG
jgi:hypothetical protein